MANRVSTKDQIVKAAEELISSKGTNNFSLRDVASKCDISLGTLYYYYKSKNDLLIDILTRHLKTLDEDYFIWLKKHKNDLKPERFLDIIFLKGVTLYDRAKIHIFLLNECLGNNKELLELYKDLYSKWLENLRIGTQQVFKGIKDSKKFANVLMLIIDGLIIQEVLKRNTTKDLEDVKESMRLLADE